MRRSMAPSQRLSFGGKRDENDLTQVPMHSAKKIPRRRSMGADITNTSQSQTLVLSGSSPESLTEHEARVRAILSRPFVVPIRGWNGMSRGTLGLGKNRVNTAMHNPFEENALVLFEPITSAQPTNDPKSVQVHVVVDPCLSKVLRPHQREGVQFMYDCLTGVKLENGEGCIMADDMGLGKTLQCVTLVWTLLKQGPYAKRLINKGIIVAPSSLVQNWANEFKKWLGPTRVSCLVMDGGKKTDIRASLNRFMDQGGTNRRVVYHMLVISYETFRLYADILCKKEVGMVICDEGHRLKNSQSQTYEALHALKTKKRIIVSGTPIQNDLTEYFSLLDFVNPGILGTRQEFHRHYEIPIMNGRDADASDDQLKKGQEKLNDLAAMVNKFIIRRTASINKKYLPTKVEQVVFCRLSKMQQAIYEQYITSKAVTALLKDDSSKVGGSSLQAITLLKKLCNHPSLIYDKMMQDEGPLKNTRQLLPANYNPKTQFLPELSGKLAVLDQMLALVRATTSDKVVLVSNYTQTLDLFEQMCGTRRYQFIRLDGSLSIKKRQKLVDQFNDPEGTTFLFLLSSKAGGCGLNLIGANRLVLFDPDWNPATDLQAMARVWRDGQKKTCFIYRLVSTGSIEEKIFQRQAHKQALSSCVVDEEEDVQRHFAMDDLRDLFKFKPDTICDTHDTFKCKRCVGGMAIRNQAMKTTTDEDLQFDMSMWDHFSVYHKLEDTILKKAAGDIVSFVFHNRFD